jgi:hypothetical protein
MTAPLTTCFGAAVGLDSVHERASRILPCERCLSVPLTYAAVGHTIAMIVIHLHISRVSTR